MSRSAAAVRSPTSSDPRLLAGQLQAALTRRLNACRQRMHLPSSEQIEANPCLAERLCIVEQLDVIDGFEVEEASYTRIELPNTSNIQCVPAWMMSSSTDSSHSATSSGDLPLSLRSLHPSREFANAHVEPRFAAVVDAHVAESTFALERRTWRIVNYTLAVDSEPSEVIEVNAICEEKVEPEEAGAGRIAFKTPLFQSLRFPGALTLRYSRTVDEEASQYAWSEAERDQAFQLDAVSPAERAAFKEVVEADYLRLKEQVTFLNEAIDSSTPAAPTPELLPCLRTLFHRYSLPFHPSSIRLLHALTGFEFMNHLLTASASLQQHLEKTVYDCQYQQQLQIVLSERILQLLWPETASTDEQLKLSDHCRANVVQPQAYDEEFENTNTQKEGEDEPETIPSSSFSKLARIAADASSFVDDSASSSAAVDSNAASEKEAPQPQPADDAQSTVHGLITSYLTIVDWTFECEHLLRPAASSAVTKSKSSAKHGKGKTKGRR